MVSVMFVDTILSDFSKGLSSIILWCLWKLWCLYKANAMGDTTKPDNSEINSVETVVGTNDGITGIETIDDDRLEGVERKVDILISDKINKTLKPVSY